MKKKKIIFFELNEVPLRIFEDSFRYLSYDSKLSDFNYLPTFVRDKSHLSPWTTWSTFYRGLDNSDHKITSLKQDRETFKKSLQTIDTQLIEVKEKWGVVVESKKKLEDNIKYHNDNDTENKYVTALKQDESGRQLKIDLENLKDVVQIKVD